MHTKTLVSSYLSEQLGIQYTTTGIFISLYLICYQTYHNKAYFGLQHSWPQSDWLACYVLRQVSEFWLAECTCLEADLQVQIGHFLRQDYWFTNWLYSHYCKHLDKVAVHLETSDMYASSSESRCVFVLAIYASSCLSRSVTDTFVLFPLPRPLPRWKPGLIPLVFPLVFPLVLAFSVVNVFWSPYLQEMNKKSMWDTL